MWLSRPLNHVHACNLNCSKTCAYEHTLPTSACIHIQTRFENTETHPMHACHASMYRRALAKTLDCGCAPHLHHNLGKQAAREAYLPLCRDTQAFGSIDIPKQIPKATISPIIFTHVQAAKLLYGRGIYHPRGAHWRGLHEERQQLGHLLAERPRVYP